MTTPPPMSVWRLDGPEDVGPYFTWLAGVLDSGQPIAIDTETGSVHSLWTELPLTGRGHCRLYQIGTATEAWAIDAQDWHYVIRRSQEMVATASCLVLFANAPYDQSVFRKEGWPIVPWHRVEDVVIAHRLARFSHYQHGLKPGAADELGAWAMAGKDELDRVMEESGWTWETIPTDIPEYWMYGCMDVCLTVLLWNALKGDLIPWYRVEVENLRLAWDETQRGILLDPHAVEKGHDYWTSVMDQAAEVLDQLGFSKPGSNKVVMQVFKELGHEPEEFSAKTGDPSYNKMVLVAIQELGGPMADAAEHLLAWRSASSWRNNYGRKLLRFMDSSNRIHPDINTMEARTGRTIIREPPLQTIPKDAIARDMFVPDAGHKLVAIDYASQEVREMAALSNDTAMAQFFSSDANDYHLYVAELAGIPRDAAKTVNYARPYGASSATMARTARCSVLEMDGYLRQIDTAFPQVMKWKDEVTREAELRASVDGYPWVELPYGRRASLFKGKEYTQAANTIIQGHGADVLKLARCRLAQAGIDRYFVLPMHDEQLLSVPVELVAEVTELASELMVDRHLSIPLTTEASEPLDRWGDKFREEDPA